MLTIDIVDMEMCGFRLFAIWL